jgi:CHAT domain-containing protein
MDALLGTSVLGLAEAQAALGPDEALVIADLATPGEVSGTSWIFAISAGAADWHEVAATPGDLAALVGRLRAGIDLRLGLRAGVALKPRTASAAPAGFDLDAAAELYALTFGRVASVIDGKSHLYTDLRGALTAIPPQILVRQPGGDLAGADWLVRHHAVTVLPSVLALQTRALAGQGGRAAEPFLGYADPVFDPPTDAPRLAGVAPGTLRGMLAPLPETAGEARRVALALASGPEAVRAGAGATEAALKAERLDAYRVLYFATHGLVAGDLVAGGEVAEPALALGAGGGEDGLLTASEVAALRLNADWVVLSACNTALGAEPGAEALSGLAQAFIYAGARALLVSHWPVESQSAVALMTDLFARRAADPGLTAAEAQQQAILAMIADSAHPDRAHPASWAPFILGGDPG